MTDALGCVGKYGMMNNLVGSYKGTSHWSVVLIKLSSQLFSSETYYSTTCLLMDRPPMPMHSTSISPEEIELMVSEVEAVWFLADSFFS